jgi:hypothetical protein
MATSSESSSDSEVGANMMTKRAVRIVQHLGPVPCVAACTACGKKFTAPMSTLRRVTEAQANLQEQFDRHRCGDEEPGEV